MNEKTSEKSPSLRQRIPAKKSAPPKSPLIFDRFELDVLKLLRRHWMLLFFGLALGWVGAAAYFLLIPPTFESQAHILLQPKNPAVDVRGNGSGRDTNSTFSDDLLATHLMLIQSPAIVEAALKKEDLLNLPSLVDANPEGGSVVDYTISRLYVSRGGEGKAKNAQVLRLAMRHENAQDVEKVVGAIAREFQSFVNRKYADVNQDAAVLIETAQGKLKTDLENAEEEFRKFREEAPLLWSGDHGTNVYRAEYEQVASALTDLRLSRSELSSRLELVESQLKQIELNNGSDLERLALVDEKHAERISVFLEIYAGKAESQLFHSRQPERLEAARSEYEGLLTLQAEEKSLVNQYGKQHPEVQRVRDQISTVQEFLDKRSGKLRIHSDNTESLTPGKLVDAYVGLLRHDLKSLDDRENRLVKQSKDAQEQAKSLAQFESKGEQLHTLVQRQRDLYEATIDRLRDINLAKDFGGFVNEMLKSPELGEEVWPKLPICMLLGTLAGLVFGASGAVIADFRNRSIRSIKEIEQITDAPAISIIPSLDYRTASERRRLAESGSTISSAVRAYHSPRSKEAEIFGGLRTLLLFKANDLSAKVIAVTSPNSGDGKSTVIANLAVSMAQAGRRVLLIDADMRRPNIAKIFGLANTIGMADVLDGSATMEEVIMHSECPRLDVITSGQIPANPSELLSSHQLKRTLNEAKENYDFVFVDCPPVLAVADPCVIASAADNMLMVLRLNPQSRVELTRATQLLNDVDAGLMGIIVNASRIESIEGGPTGEYGIGYGYGTRNANEYFATEATTI